MNRDFSKIIINCSSQSMTAKEFAGCLAVYNEQTFGGIIVDPCLLDLASSFKKKRNSRLYCSCNFPFHGLTNDISINAMVYIKTLQNKSEISGFFTSTQKMDIENNVWKTVRSFVSEINDVVYEDVYLSIDPTWCNNPEDLSKMFSIISGYDKIHPLVSIKGKILENFEKNISIISDLFKTSSVNNVNVFLPNIVDLDTVLKCIDLELGDIVIHPKTALEISRET